MPRAIWSGHLSFGLVEIPVSLVAAEESGAEIEFTYLDRRDLSPVGYERVSKKTGKVVPWSEVVKGYEHADDRYVVLTDEDLRKANPKATRTIEILDFVDGAAIDPVYYEKPYYLEPARKNSKGYALLRETLRRTGKVGVARVVLRTRQRLAILFARGKVLTLNLIRYAHELRDEKTIDVPGDRRSKRGISIREVEMAEQIVEGMTSRWDPKKYKDAYREDVLAMVRRKVKAGRTRVIEVPEEEEPEMAEVVDLMPLLRRSVEKTKSVGKTRTGKQKHRKTRRAGSA